MKTKQFIFVIAVFTFFISISFGSKMVMAESLKDSIKKSMEETKEQQERLETCFMEIHRKFEEKGYDADISFSMDEPFSKRDPTITIHVKDKKDKKDHEKEIKQIVKNAIKSNKLGDVAVKVKTRPKGFGEISEEDERRAQQNDEIFDITFKVLKQNGYNISSLGMYAKSPKTIEVEIEGTKEYFNKVKNDIKKLVHDALYSKKQIDYTVKVKRKSDAQMRDEKWHPIFQSIIEELNKQFDVVTGFGYSFHPEPLQIIIKTSLSNKNPDEPLITKIEKYVDTIIEIKQEELSIEKEPYNIIIRGKKQEKLN